MASFWPGSIFLALAGVYAWTRRREPATRVLLAWIVPSWIMFELAATKLPHYTLPFYPAIALLTGRALLAAAEEGLQLSRPWIGKLVFGLWLIVTLMLAVGFNVLPIIAGDGLVPAGLAVALFLALIVWALFLDKAPPVAPAAVVSCILAAIVLYLPVFNLILPTLDKIWLSPAAARLVSDYGQPPGVPVVAVGYAEPSLVFLLGTDTKLIGPEAAAEFITGRRGASALVTSQHDQAFRAALAARGFEPRPHGQITGYNYSNARSLTITLYTTVPG
jgi:4-amino-4-deoxy-L-arabinose transferase-like glycosyltransferase